MAADTDSAQAFPAAPRRIECHSCGLIQAVPTLVPGQRARCQRCDIALCRPPDHGNKALTRATLCAVAAIILFIAALNLPLLDLRSLGRLYRATLFTGPTNLEATGTDFVSGLVVLTLIVLPLAELMTQLVVMLCVRKPDPPWFAAPMFTIALRLRPFAMTEVFILGVAVAITRLQVIAEVDIGPALIALCAMVVCLIAMLNDLDPIDIWSRIPAQVPPDDGPGQLIGCDNCRLVFTGTPNCACPRCQLRVRVRKSQSIVRCSALLAAGVLFYLPANLFPVMTVVRFGQGAPSTIVGGVIELAQLHMWPLAILVFTASVAVPLLKMAGLLWMIIATKRRSAYGIETRTWLYHAIEGVGRWSMIDVFMLTVLVALVRMGFVATVTPGTGAGAFAAVVILTMLASASFDPRLMWDAIGENK